MQLKFQVKICGITRAEDVRAVINAGGDAIGLNFVRSSPRYVSLELGAQLSQLAEGMVIRVGVVQNPSPSELSAIIAQVPLDAVQLHGQENPELIDSCGHLPVIKALSWRGDGREEALASAWRTVARSRLNCFLIDAAAHGCAGGIGGGSGRTANWDLLYPRPAALEALPLVLAGGLRPDNVVQAIQATGCDGVDTASGVESSPGIKDAELMRRFIKLAKSMW